MPENDARTPNGMPCWIAGQELAEVIRNQAKGSYQKELVEAIITKGYVIQNKLSKSRSRYDTSIAHLMNRIDNVLPGTLHIEEGPTGLQGGFGYRLVI